MITLSGRVVTPTQVIDGQVRIDRDRIVEICTGRPRHKTDLNFGRSWILPGFIDLHMHGLGEYEPLDTASLLGMAQLQLRSGTTAFLPTGAAMSVGQYLDLGRNARQAAQELEGNGAKIPGVHLEGPFINPKSSGAMDASTRRPIEFGEARRYVQEIGDVLKIMTFSPELPGGIELIQLLRKTGVVASLGHSIAAGEELAAFVKAGLSHVVHLFNAFQPSGLLEPGVFKAGLIEHILVNESLTCEVICDLQHVAPQVVQIAERVLGPDRFVAITDSVFGTGLQDGLYAFPNGGRYRIADGVARLDGGAQDGCLAGSVLTMNRAFANLIGPCRIDPVRAAKYTSTNAARVLGLDRQMGSIEPGKYADLAILDDTGQCHATFINGELVYRS